MEWHFKKMGILNSRGKDTMKKIQLQTTPMHNTPPGYIRANFLLFLLFSLGVSLRFYNSRSESLWDDEGQSARIAQIGFTEILHELILDVHPPVYFFCLHIWSLLFGNSEFALRSFSVLAGGISILLSYAIGKQLFSKTIGLITALFIALNTYQIAISQEARMYSLLFCLALVSSYFYILILKNRGNFRVKAAYFISTILLLYTHIHGIFVLCAQCLTILTLSLVKRDKLPEHLRGILVLQLLIGMSFLPWIFVVKLQFLSHMEAWIPTPSFATLFETFLEFSGSHYVVIVFLSLLCIALFSRNILLKIPFLRKLFVMDALGKHDFNLMAILFSLIWLCTVILLPFTISKTAMSIYKTKYVVAALLPFVLISVYGIMVLSSKWIKVAITVTIVILSILNTKTYFLTLHKDQWREAVRYIESYVQPGDVLIFNAGFNLQNAYNYYSKRDDLIKIPFPSKSTRVNLSVDENNIHELDSVIGKYNHIWIIASQNKDPKGLISQKMDAHYNFLGKQHFKGVGIFVFEHR